VTYINGSLIRPPLLPILLGVLGAALPQGAALRVFNGLQAGLALVAAAAVAGALSARLDLRARPRALLFALALFPQLHTVVTISSESFAYSFVCLAFVSVLPLVWGETSIRALVATCIACALASATRGQFIYLAPCCVAVTLYLLAREKDSGRRVRILLACAAIPLLTLGLQAAHSVRKTGHFTRVAVTGLQTMTLATLSSEESDLAGIDDPYVQDFAREVRTCAVERKLLPKQSPEIVPAIVVATHYNDILACIYHSFFVEREHLSVPWGGPPENVEPELYVKVDKLTLAATRGIARRAWKRIVIADISQITLWERYPAILAAAFAFVALLGYRRNPPIARLVLLVTGLWWINVLLVVALEPAQGRYTFYFNQLMIVTAVALAWRGLRGDYTEAATSSR
jgi:hypothetical protein